MEPIDASNRVWLSVHELENRYPRARHEALLHEAITLGRQAGVEARTGGPFGALVANRQGLVVGRGTNRVLSELDPTAHGEMEAIRDACKRLQVYQLAGCVLYTSSEPCPMCLAAAYWARLDGIVYAASVEDARTFGGFDDSFLFEQLHKPAQLRALPRLQLLHEEALEVWKEYAGLPGKVPY